MRRYLADPTREPDEAATQAATTTTGLPPEANRLVADPVELAAHDEQHTLLRAETLLPQGDAARCLAQQSCLLDRASKNKCELVLSRSAGRQAARSPPLRQLAGGGCCVNSVRDTNKLARESFHNRSESLFIKTAAMGISDQALQPDNVFIVSRSTNPEFVKVLDFGVAKLRGESAVSGTDDKLTATGMIIGTAPYMSPEQWNTLPDVDGRADIYALGVIVYELLTGTRPYAARTAYEWILLHNTATPPDLQQYGIAPQLARIVKRMLSRLPAQRQQTMREVIQDLRTAGRNQKNIPAFAIEGTQVSAGAMTTDMIAVRDVPQTLGGAHPSFQQPGYQEPLKIPTPIPSLPQPAPSSQPSYQAPAPVAQPSHQAPAPQYNSFQLANPTPQYGYQQPPPSYQPTPYQSQRPPEDPLRNARLKRVGEFLLGVVIVVIYLIVYWQDTLTFLRNFAHSLRFGL